MAYVLAGVGRSEDLAGGGERNGLEQSGEGHMIRHRGRLCRKTKNEGPPTSMKL